MAADWTPGRRVTVAKQIYGSLFAEQQAAVADPCRRKVLWTTRRAGKTWTPLADFVAKGLIRQNSMFVYIALTYNNAEIIAWPILKEMDARYKLGCRFQEQKLRCTMPGGSVIQLYGADRPGWSSRLYGTKLLGAAIDEAAFFRVDLNDLVDDVLGAALAQTGGDVGTLYLTSIPGKMPRGLFYELTRGFHYEATFAGETPQSTEMCPTASRWSVHTWTTDANPWMRDRFHQEIKEWLEADPNAEKDPRFLRNYRKAWVAEMGEQVYLFDSEINTYPHEWTPQPDDNYVIGIDFGWHDATAVSQCVWREDYPALVELDSWKASNILLSNLAVKVREYLPPAGTGFTILGDPAHRQLFEEFRRAYELPVMEGEKSQKSDAIQVINSELRAGRVLVRRPASSPHVKEMQQLRWKVKPDGSKVEQPGQPNDCCDAFMLVHRHARHYLRGETEPEVQTQAQINRAEREAMIEAEIARLQDADGGRWNDF